VRDGSTGTGGPKKELYKPGDFRRPDMPPGPPWSNFEPNRLIICWSIWPNLRKGNKLCKMINQKTRAKKGTNLEIYTSPPAPFFACPVQKISVLPSSSWARLCPGVRRNAANSACRKVREGQIKVSSARRSEMVRIRRRGGRKEETHGVRIYCTEITERIKTKFLREYHHW